MVAHDPSKAPAALALWREREMGFPRFTRRMTPDAMDFASGAWDAAVRAVRADADRLSGNCEETEKTGQPE